MAAMFFTRNGLNLFYMCIALYLYGDLAIYAAAISKSLRDMICTYDNCTKSALEGLDPCWDSHPYFDRSAVYRLLIVVVATLLGPFTFFNVQKTKYLQVFTSLLRWLSFTSMIVLSFIAIFDGRRQGEPKKMSLYGVPSLFGICVYSFMCHHSLPSLITPINNKRGLHLRIGLVYLLILSFYYLLSLTGIFTFPIIEDVYTLNFQKER
jgi:amino acid permease